MAESIERWTPASVYPDMWLDPDDDPRNTDGSSADGELATLLDYFSDYRQTLRMKCGGLTPAQLARRSVPPSLPTRSWVSGWGPTASPSVSCTSTGSRSTRGTVATPTCCANASTVGSADSSSVTR